MTQAATSNASPAPATSSHHFIIRDPLATTRTDDAVHPLAVAPVRLALDALAYEAGPLGMLDRPLVEPVDLELQPVVVQVDEQVALKNVRRLVGEVAAAKVRVHRQSAEVRDAAAAVRDVVTEDPRAPPVAVLLDLDHEPPGLPGLRHGLLDLGLHVFARMGANDREIGLDVFVRSELRVELRVVRARPPEPEAVAGEDLAHGAAGTASACRRRRNATPEPSAVPMRISTRPAIAWTVIGSSSNSAP